jgi:hypothetical protein
MFSVAEPNVNEVHVVPGLNAEATKADFRSKLDERGFFMTSDIKASLSPNTWDELIRFTQQTRHTWRRCYLMSDKDSRINSSSIAFSTTAEKDASGLTTFLSKKMNPTCVDMVVYDIVEAYLPAGKYVVDVMFADDLAGIGDLYRDGFDRARQNGYALVERHEIPRLFWHQDKCDLADFPYLFFAVLECSGNICPKENLLQIASVPRVHLARAAGSELAHHVPNEYEYTVRKVQEVEGRTGSGYMINQDFVFKPVVIEPELIFGDFELEDEDEAKERDSRVYVHAHGRLTFGLTCFHIDEVPPRAQHLLFSPDQQLSGANHFGSDAFCLRRVKLIVRVSKNIS